MAIGDGNDEDAAITYGEQEVLNETATASFVMKLKCIVIEADSPDVNLQPSTVPEKLSLNAKQGKYNIFLSNRNICLLLPYASAMTN